MSGGLGKGNVMSSKSGSEQCTTHFKNKYMYQIRNRERSGEYSELEPDGRTYRTMEMLLFLFKQVICLEKD